MLSGLLKTGTYSAAVPAIHTYHRGHACMHGPARACATAAMRTDSMSGACGRSDPVCVGATVWSGGYGEH